MTNLSLPKHFKVSDHVLFQEIMGNYVLLNMESEKYFGLDEVGARVWQILADEENPSKVLEQLQAEYDVDPEILRKDLIKLIEEMRQENLIIVEE